VIGTDSCRHAASVGLNQRARTFLSVAGTNTSTPISLYFG